MHCRYAAREFGGETCGSWLLLCPMCATTFSIALCTFAWGLAWLQLHESQAPHLRLVSTAAVVSCTVNHGISCVWELESSPLYIHQKGSKANALAKHLSPCRSEHQVNTVLCLNYGRYITAQMLPKMLRFGRWAWVIYFLYCFFRRNKCLKIPHVGQKASCVLCLWKQLWLRTTKPQKI